MILVALKCAEKNPSASTTLQRRPDPSLYITKAQVEAPDSCTNTHTQSGCCSHHCDWPNSASRASSLRWSIIKPPFATRDLLLRFRGESFPASARPPGRLSAAAHPLLCCSVELHVCLSLSHHSEREAAATEVTPEVRRLLRSSLGNKEWTCLFLIYIHSFSRSVMENDLQRRKNKH